MRRSNPRPASWRPASSRAPYNWALALLVWLFLLNAASVSGQDQITASATLSSSSVMVDQLATLSITVNGTRSAEVELPGTDGFEIVQQGRSSQFNLINGNYSSSVTFTCILRPFSPGSYTIPPITIHAEGRSITTEAIPFSVTNGAVPGGSGAAPGKNHGGNNSRPAFLTAKIPKQTAYVGEMFPLEIKAYFQRGMRASLRSLPELTGDGLVMGQLSDKPSQTQEAVNGLSYNVLTWRTSLSAIKAGTHPIRLELQAVEQIPQKRVSTSIFGRQSPFDDDFFDSMLGGYTQRPLKLASKERPLEVSPLPEEGRPKDFSGAIGAFYVHAHAEPTEVEPGEPITLSISVRGRGNFDRVEVPALPEELHHIWRTYSPVATFHPGDETGLSGEKMFEQAVVARGSEVTEIPSLAFSYFDPDKGVYVSAETPPIPVRITASTTTAPALGEPAAAPQTQAGAGDTVPARQTAAPAEPEKEVPAPAIQGLAPLHLAAGEVSETIKPVYRKPWFQLYIVVCLLLIVTAVIIRVRRRLAQGSPEEQRRIQKLRQLNSNMAALKQAEDSGNSSAYLNLCRAVIQHHLGSLWQCEPGAITSTSAASRLPAGSRLAAVLTRAEHAVYSGAYVSPEEMAETTQTVQHELEKLI